MDNTAMLRLSELAVLATETLENIVIKDGVDDSVKTQAAKALLEHTRGTLALAVGGGK